MEIIVTEPEEGSGEGNSTCDGAGSGCITKTGNCWSSGAGFSDGSGNGRGFGQGSGLGNGTGSGSGIGIPNNFGHASAQLTYKKRKKPKIINLRNHGHSRYDIKK